MCTKTGGGVSSAAARTQSSIVLRLVFAKKSDIERLIAWLGEIGYGEARAAEAQIQNLDEEKLAVEVAIHGQSDPVWLRPCNGLAQGFAADPDAVLERRLGIGRHHRRSGRTNTDGLDEIALAPGRFGRIRGRADVWELPADWRDGKSSEWAKLLAVPVGRSASGTLRSGICRAAFATVPSPRATATRSQGSPSAAL